MAPRPINQWNGPDGIDLAQMIRAMQELHEGSTVTVELRSDGSLYAGSLYVTARASAPQMVGPGKCWKEEIAVTWPNNKSRTLEGCIYRTLHELDAKMSRELWRQETFA